MRSACRLICWSCLCLVARRAPADIPVTIRTIDGQDFSGSLVAFNESSVAIDTGGNERRFALTDLFEVRNDAARPATRSPVSYLFLTSGDRVGVEVLRLREELLVCRWPSTAEDLEFEIALETVLGIVLQPAPQARTGQSLERELQRRSLSADVLFLTNGDRLTGVLEALSRDSCRCETAVGSLEVNRSRIRAIGFNAALLAPAETPETELLLHFTDGSWLTCRSVQWAPDGDALVHTANGDEVPVPGHKLRSIVCYGPRVTPLSDLEPLDVLMTPYLSREVAPRRNRNAWDGPLKVRGESYARGLGMYSRTTVTYGLNGEYSEFRAIIGIDDAAGGTGSVVFTVAIDGRNLFDSGLVTGRDAPMTVGPIDVRQAQTLTLSVDYGTQGDIGDLADWCNPVLFKGLKTED